MASLTGIDIQTIEACGNAVVIYCPESVCMESCRISFPYTAIYSTIGLHKSTNGAQVLVPVAAWRFESSSGHNKKSSSFEGLFLL